MADDETLPPLDTDLVDEADLEHELDDVELERNETEHEEKTFSKTKVKPSKAKKGKLNQKFGKAARRAAQTKKR
jgi:hypothetical protein